MAAYVAHLADISAIDPIRLTAHVYTQHLALLAGGQRIRKFVASTVPGLQGKEGVSVFNFEVRPQINHASDATAFHTGFSDSSLL